MADQNCLISNDWICGEYVRTRSQELTDATLQHVWITLASVAIGLVIAFPLALLARRWRTVAGPVLGMTTILYTVPSLAMFSLLLPVFGISAAVVITGLVLYSLTILVRNILAGLAAVPEDAREAARGMGYGPMRLLFGVELPLALPALMAGLRITTVSTISLTTVGAIIGYGGLGNLIYDGMRGFFKAEVLTASVLCVALAVVADLLLLGLQRLLTPWTWKRRRTVRVGGGAGAGAAAHSGSGGADGSGGAGGPQGGSGGAGAAEEPEGGRSVAHGPEERTTT